MTTTCSNGLAHAEGGAFCPNCGAALLLAPDHHPHLHLDDDADLVVGAVAAENAKGNPDYVAILRELQGAITWLRWAAVAVFTVGAGGAAAAVVELPGLTKSAAATIAKSGNSINMTVFELLRGAAFAAAVTSVLFGIFTLGRACLDQATRFQKRLIAAHFLNFVLHSNRELIERGDMKISEVVKFLKAWSANVESAFTHVKFGSAKSQATELSVGPSGLNAKTGPTQAS